MTATALEALSWATGPGLALTLAAAAALALTLLADRVIFRERVTDW